jgi:hypothetical protein
MPRIASAGLAILGLILFFIPVFLLVAALSFATYYLARR